MHEGRTVFAELMDWLPRYELVKRDFPLRRNINWTEMDKTGHFWGKVGSLGNE